MRGKALLTTVLVLTVWPARAQISVLDTADSLFSLFKYKAAIDAYLDVRPEDSFRRLSGLSVAENLLGLDFLAGGERDSAEAHFENAIDAAEVMDVRYPDSAGTSFNLAAAYGNLALFRGGKTKVRIGRDVERYAQRAIEIDPTYGDALSVLGVFYREVAKLSWIERFVARALFGGLPSGGLEQSERYLVRAVEGDPSSPFAAFELGQTLIDMKRPAEARRAWERLMTLTPRNSENARNMRVAAAWLASAEGG